MTRVGLALAVAAAALVGCKSNDTAQSGSSGAAGSDQAPPPRARPSSQPQPKLQPLPLPDDPKRADKVALGHVLFFDKRLSVDGSRACYSCHQNEDGTGGHDPIAIGAGDKVLTRHAPVMWNVAYFKNALYWDGRAPTLEANAKMAWSGGNLGVPADKLDAKATELAAIPGYKKLFDAAFPGTAPTAELVEQALAEYERTLLCNATAYDKFTAGDKTALTEPQLRGLDVFFGKAQCVMCHTPPTFSLAAVMDGGQYFNIGIGTSAAPDKIDIGRMKVTNDPADWAAFKPPTLRNITASAPYFHDGSVAKLDDAVKLMASGGIANKNRTEMLADRHLTDAERGDLVAFLGALACPGTLDAPTLP